MIIHWDWTSDQTQIIFWLLMKKVLCHMAARGTFPRTSWRVAWSALLRFRELVTIENRSQLRIDHNWELILFESNSGPIFRYLVKNVENNWCSSNQSFWRYWLLKFNPSVARYWDGFQTSPGRRGRGERISILGGNRLSHWSLMASRRGLVSQLCSVMRRYRS